MKSGGGKIFGTRHTEKVKYFRKLRHNYCSMPYFFLILITQIKSHIKNVCLHSYFINVFINKLTDQIFHFLDFSAPIKCCFILKLRRPKLMITNNLTSNSKFVCEKLAQTKARERGL